MLDIPTATVLTGLYLVRVNLTDGTTTQIAELNDDVADMDFASNGILYGVVGDGGNLRSTLVTINTTDATVTSALAFGTFDDDDSTDKEGGRSRYMTLSHHARN